MKNKLNSVKEKYDYLLKRHYENSTNPKTGEDKLFERTLWALLELRECEEIYKNNQDFDFDIYTWYEMNFVDAESYSGIINHCRDNIYELKVNDINLDIEFAFTDELMNNNFEKNENDNSEIFIEPLFIEEFKKPTNRIGGIKFKLKSQMGYEVHYSETNLESLKELQNKINRIIERIESREYSILVKDYGMDYRFKTKCDFLSFPDDQDYRNDLLYNDHGISKYFKIVKVERDHFGDEIWYVEGFESLLNSNQYKIRVEGYPCTFTFTVPKEFEPFNKKNDFDEKRQKVLLNKMKKLNVPTNGHAYEDFIIEKVKKIKGGEIWKLGS